MTQVDISSTIMGVLATFAITSVVAVVAQYFDYKSFKKQTVEKLRQVDEHLKFSDSKQEDIKNMLTEIMANQKSHEKRDEEVFDSISGTLIRIENNFKEMWQKK